MRCTSQPPARFAPGRRACYHRFLDETELGLVLPHVRGRDVLEVGCGTGLILRHLDEVANRAAGIDLAPGMLEHAAGTRDGTSSSNDRKRCCVDARRVAARGKFDPVRGPLDPDVIGAHHSK